MKNLLFLCGPNGIGKTTISMEIINQLPRSAYVDSDSCRVMNPFVLDDDTIPTISKNISDLIFNYWSCPLVDTVVFSYGFHGRRKEVFQTATAALSKQEHQFIPILLWCSEEENIRRMKADRRDQERIVRAVKESRKAFDGVTYLSLDVTELTAMEAAKTVLQMACLG